MPRGSGTRLFLRSQAMNIKRTLLLTAVLTASLAAGNRAQAQCGVGAYGFGHGYWDIGRLYSVLADNVPYYAAFPPVYYSYPVPRTYGYSPFAYPPGVMTPDVEVEPLVIENPHVDGAEVAPEAEEVAPAPADPTTSVKRQRGPQVVINPFVQSRSIAQR
jgi:hypothetical protein